MRANFINGGLNGKVASAAGDARRRARNQIILVLLLVLVLDCPIYDYEDDDEDERFARAATIWTDTNRVSSRIVA